MALQLRKIGTSTNKITENSWQQSSVRGKVGDIHGKNRIIIRKILYIWNAQTIAIYPCQIYGVQQFYLRCHIENISIKNNYKNISDLTFIPVSLFNNPHFKWSNIMTYGLCIFFVSRSFEFSLLFFADMQQVTTGIIDYLFYGFIFKFKLC